MKKGFTLIEILIVVTILGIVAAMVIPSVQGHVEKARTAAAKETLQSLRHQIELYKFEHEDAVPGFAGGSPISPLNTVRQFTNCTKVDGSVSPFTKKTGEYVCGPYLPKMAKNPFNKLDTITIVPVGTDFSAAVDGTSSGWLYKAGTCDIRLNSTGTDERGVKHYEL
ncbi:MAG: type II secretion system protein [Planctomycetes bacterium]|nr:type II secretion system protein [Planctomycetota bacterium]